MISEKEKKLIDFIKLVSPGTPLRKVINDLLRSGLGGLIIFNSQELQSLKIFEGGFKINSRFTPEKLFELCKMDGGIILSNDIKRILYANVLMHPDNSLHTNETGTRHKASERTAKQANTFVIAVSERKKKTTLYYGASKYYLKTTDELLRNTSSTINILEKQRENLEKSKENLSILEMSESVSVNDVCKVIQKAEMILKTSESVKRNFAELGKEGNVMHMRFRELIRGVEKTLEEVLRDYSILTLKKSKKILTNITFEGLLDLESIARLTLEKTLEESISPRGYRFLSHLTISKKEISQIVNQFENIKNVLYADSTRFEQILKNRSKIISEEILNLREQILNGKVIC